MEFMEETLKRLRGWAEGIPALPVRLNLDATARCNLDCLICDLPHARRVGKEKAECELTSKQWERVIQEGLDLGVLEWWFSGAGDPFFYPKRMLRFVEMIKGHSPLLRCHITTNGTRLDENACRTLVELGMDDINFSIDGPTPEIHDYLRNRKGAFERTSTAMKTISSLREELGTEKPTTTITLVLNSKNYPSLPEMVDLAAKNGSCALNINPLRISPENEGTINEEGLQTSKGQEKEIRRIFIQCQKKARKVGIRFEFNGMENFMVGVRSSHPKAEGFDCQHVDSSIRENILSRHFYGAACFEPFIYHEN